ncbi:MAG: methyltransferase [Streptosporangiaceae bacterium]
MTEYPQDGTAGQDAAPAMQLCATIEGMMAAQVIGTAARLGLADHLAPGPKPAGEVVRAIGAHPGLGRRFLLACATVGLLTETGPGVFALTPAGECLRSGDQSLRDLAIVTTSPGFWLSIGRLGDVVTTGRPAAERALGMTIWDYYRANPEESAHFTAAMRQNTAESPAELVRHYDFSRFTRIVDVGGGCGDLLAAILAAAPSASGVLFDRAEAVKAAAEVMAAQGVTGRAEVAAGDFLDEVPPGGDLYVMRLVLCDWDDDHAVRILRNCRRAGQPGARVLIAEMLLPGADAGSARHLQDLMEFTVTGGQLRTPADLEKLTAEAGYRGGQVVTALDAMSLFEAQAP